MAIAPSSLGLAYLYNPAAMMTSIAGSTCSWENLSVLLALWGAARGDGPLAGLGLAWATYLSLNPVLLVVPVALLLWKGPEGLQHMTQPVAKEAEHAEKTEVFPGTAEVGDLPAGGNPGTALKAVHGSNCEGKSGGEQQEGLQDDAGLSRAPLQIIRALPSALVFLLWYVLSLVLLVLLSDLALVGSEDSQCFPGLWRAWERRQGEGRNLLGLDKGHSSWVSGRQQCWVGSSYWWQVTQGDYEPNMGLHWYFFTEMFPHYKTWFHCVFFFLSAVFSIPLAIRFSHRPLFLAFCQMVITAQLKPYPSVADMVLYLTFLALLQPQLLRMTWGLLMCNSLLMLLVLGPAMYHQWIMVDAANSNYFYSITLLLGVWQGVLLAQMMSSTLKVDKAPAKDQA